MKCTWAVYVTNVKLKGKYIPSGFPGCDVIRATIGPRYEKFDVIQLSCDKEHNRFMIRGTKKQVEEVLVILGG